VHEPGVYLYVVYVVVVAVNLVCLCAGVIVRPTYALHHAASLSGHDVFEPLYDVSHVASALAQQDNTKLLNFLKDNGKWPGLQRVVRKVPRVGQPGEARRPDFLEFGCCGC